MPYFHRFFFYGFVIYPASILHTSIAGRYRPVSYPDGPITARYRFIYNAYWVFSTLGIIGTFRNVNEKNVPITYANNKV